MNDREREQLEEACAVLLDLCQLFKKCLGCPVFAKRFYVNSDGVYSMRECPAEIISRLLNQKENEVQK